MERRAAELEVRAKGRRLEGFAARFGVEAQLPGFTETIRAGAFKASLECRSDILALVDHDSSRVLARTRSGSLRLWEDPAGLGFDMALPATSAASDILALAERSDLGGMSIGFKVPPNGEHWDGDKRELRAVDLVEISVVCAFPAYDGTVVNARSRSALDGQRLAAARRWLETV